MFGFCCLNLFKAVGACQVTMPGGRSTSGMGTGNALKRAKVLWCIEMSWAEIVSPKLI